MVVAQLAERSFPTSEDQDSNKAISIFIMNIYFTLNCIKKTKIKKKEKRCLDWPLKIMPL